VFSFFDGIDFLESVLLHYPTSTIDKADAGDVFAIRSIV
jgi:hypothetical protein